jgi:hypothetical protein
MRDTFTTHLYHSFIQNKVVPFYGINRPIGFIIGYEIRITPTDEICAIHENLYNNLKRRSYYNLSTLQRNCLVLSASKLIKVRGMNNRCSSILKLSS